MAVVISNLFLFISFFLFLLDLPSNFPGWCRFLKDLSPKRSALHWFFFVLSSNAKPCSIGFSLPKKRRTPQARLFFWLRFWFLSLGALDLDRWWWSIFIKTAWKRFDDVAFSVWFIVRNWETGRVATGSNALRCHVGIRRVGQHLIGFLFPFVAAVVSWLAPAAIDSANRTPRLTAGRHRFRVPRPLRLVFVLVSSFSYYRLSPSSNDIATSFTDSNLILLGYTEFYQVLPGFTGVYRVFLDVFRFLIGPPGFTGFYWVSPCFIRFYQVLLSFPGFY